MSGNKGRLLEGGIRVPGIAEWPGTIEAGRVSDAPISTTDYLPTALALAETSPRPNLDGQDVSPILSGQAETRDGLIFFRDEAEWAVMDADWKLIGQDGRPAQLYNLAVDPAEKNNLAGVESDRAAALQSAFDAWEEDWKADLITR